MRRFAVVLATVGLAAGCAAPLGPKFEALHPKTPGLASVYVYRQHDGLSQGMGAALLVDGKPAAKLVPQGYMVLLLAPGSHALRPNWDARSPSSGPATRVAVREGEELFVKFHSGFMALGPSQSFSARWNEVPRETALQELRDYRLIGIVTP